MQEVHVSTDGSCLVQNASGNGAIGWAMVEHGSSGFCRSGGACYGTNQIAELTAILVALRTYRPSSGRAAKLLQIYSDSRYAIDALTKWLPGWKRKGFKGSKNKPVANLEIIQALDAELQYRKEQGGSVEFTWVKGHNGDKYNELVDSLANDTAQSWHQKLGTNDERDLSAMPKESKNVILSRAREFNITWHDTPEDKQVVDLLHYATADATSYACENI